MRTRLRPAYTEIELAEIYQVPHEHARWFDHRLRVATTIQLANAMFQEGAIADLSCGDATIARAVGAYTTILGDYAAGYEYHGPIEATIHRCPNVDLFLCCETLEHLDDPDTVLFLIRQKTRALVISTPDGETEGHNPEHYWGWDTDAMAEMLDAAGFEPRVQITLRIPGLDVAYQIWGCV